MRVLVTGGAGYVGSAVSEELVQSGHDVVVYDNLSKGHADAVPPGARFVRGDMLDGAALRSVLRENRIEAVVHAAAESLVGESMQRPGKYYGANLVGGIELLDAMVATDARTLVLSSTAA